MKQKRTHLKNHTQVGKGEAKKKPGGGNRRCARGSLSACARLGTSPVVVLLQEKKRSTTYIHMISGLQLVYSGRRGLEDYCIREERKLSVLRRKGGGGGRGVTKAKVIRKILTTNC